MTIYVFGAGGHAKVVLGALHEGGKLGEVEGIFDDAPLTWGARVRGIRVIGALEEAHLVPAKRGVLAIGDNRARQGLAARFPDWEWITVIHPRAHVDSSAVIGPGTVVFAGAVVQPEVRIGAHGIVNTGSIVDHDCRVGDFVHLAPGVNLAGNVCVGEGALVGVGASVTPGACVGAWAVIGAGSVVLDDIPAGVTAVGTPARLLKGANHK
jgi:UDP-perosamine 4-acetyltransferase